MQSEGADKSRGLGALRSGAEHECLVDIAEPVNLGLSRLES
jgi:hypothetical protein